MKLAVCALLLSVSGLAHAGVVESQANGTELVVERSGVVCSATNERGMRFFASGFFVERVRARAMAKCQAVSAHCVLTGCR